MLVMVVNKL